MKLSLGFSPCPNDTFIFDALVHRKINTLDFEFDVVLEDIQTLNEWALQGKLDITKISYGVMPLIFKEYQLLNSGGALGRGVGPLLISKKDLDVEDMDDKVIAIPGENTTANVLFSLAFPKAKKKLFKVFNEIEDAILDEKVDCGVIIHENRFTYQQRGLQKLIDLGDYWEMKTRLPIPLGGIAARKSLNDETIKKIDALVRKSVEFAFANHYEQLTDYVKHHSQEMSESVMRQHIDLYVNGLSIDLGNEGRKAVSKFFEVYWEMHR